MFSLKVRMFWQWPVTTAIHQIIRLESLKSFWIFAILVESIVMYLFFKRPEFFSVMGMMGDGRIQDILSCSSG